MPYTEQYREHIAYTFNSFCKTVLYPAAINVYRDLRRKQQYEEVSRDYPKEIHLELTCCQAFRTNGWLAREKWSASVFTIDSRSFLPYND